MDTVEDAMIGRKRTRVLRSLEEKRSIVEEAMRAGASVAAVARRHSLNANLLFAWRRLYLQGLLELPSPTPAAALVPVVMSPSTATEHAECEQRRRPALSSGVIEIELPSGIRLWICGVVDVTVVTAVCQALGVRC